jgi:hypothetical protein
VLAAFFRVRHIVQPHAIVFVTLPLSESGLKLIEDSRLKAIKPFLPKANRVTVPFAANFHRCAPI